MKDPKVGQPIRFFVDGSPSGERAAMVAKVINNGDAPIVDLSWFAGTDAEQPINRVKSVPFGPPLQPGCWHWLVGEC